jgi:hypothetical protein
MTIELHKFSAFEDVPARDPPNNIEHVYCLSSIISPQSLQTLSRVLSFPSHLETLCCARSFDLLFSSLSFNSTRQTSTVDLTEHLL